MKLPTLADFLPKRQTKKAQEYFLALQIGKTVTKAAIWEGSTDIAIKTVVSGNSPTDAIEQATKEYPTVHQIIFGLPSDYIADNKIKPSHLPELKRIAAEAHLVPIGFVVIPEAVAHYLEKETNTPQTCILLGIEDVKLTVSLFRIGKCVKVVELPRTESIFADVEKGLTAFEAEEILPSKLVLYNGSKPLDELKEQLLSYPWQKNEKFLHVPKIEALPWEFSIKAIVFAGVSDNQEDTALHTQEAENKEESPVLPPDSTPPENGQEKQELATSSEPIEIQQEETEEPSLVVHESGQEHMPNKSFGFTVHTDIPEVPSATSFTPREPLHADEAAPKRKWSLPAVPLPALSLPSSFPVPKTRGIIPITAAVLLFLGLFAATYYAYPKATIALIAEPNVIDNEITITLNTSLGEVDVAGKQIPGKVYTVKVDGTTSNETTGKKTIGEKAAGEVIVYNKSSQSRTLTKGTTVSASSVVFTLDTDVTVASASDTGESLTYGKEKVRVTAAKIGPGGNLKKDSEFTVGDLVKSAVAAKNEADFSGGTEREISMVSKDDQDKLIKQLTETLNGQARQKLQEQLTSREQFLDESIQNNIAEKKFDKDVGAESDNLALSLSLEYSQIAYDQENLTKFFEAYMKEQISDQYEFDAGKSRFDVKKVEQNSDGKITFTATYHAYLLPKIDVAPYAKEFSGLSKKNLESKVLGLSDKKIVGYDVTYDRQLPLLKDKLPVNSKNITVKVVPY